MIDIDLVAAATVGAAHRAVDLTALPTELRPDPLPPEPGPALLDAAALQALARRTAPALRPAARPDGPAIETRAETDDTVRQVLTRLADRQDLLIEALGLIDQAGQRIPADLVPVLLSDNRRPVVLATRPVVGEVGRWLMRKNPRWSATTADPTDRSGWTDGTQSERLAWLRRLRATDPGAVRDLLTAELSGESAADRAAFLAVLELGLEAADEPLLLRAVQDRSRAVVPVALDLLTRLPGSALRRDLATLLTRHVHVHRGLLRTTVTLTEPDPAEFGTWPLTDGLADVVARVDPADWPALVGTDLLRLLHKQPDELEPLLPAIIRATITFRHSAVAEHLITPTLSAKDPKPDPGLWSALDPEVATRLVLHLIERRVGSLRIQQALETLPRPYHRDLALRLPAWLATAINGNVPAQPALWNDWAAAVAPADCRAAADVARALAPTGEAGSGLLTRAGKAATLLTLRSVLAESFHRTGESR